MVSRSDLISQAQIQWFKIIRNAVSSVDVVFRLEESIEDAMEIPIDGVNVSDITDLNMFIATRIRFVQWASIAQFY